MKYKLILYFNIIMDKSLVFFRDFKFMVYYRKEAIIKTLDLFFIIFFINLFINFYLLYTFIDIKILHNEQGSKLKIKNYLK